jgi:hypothetical protein
MSGFHPQICRDVHIKGCVVLGLMANAYFWAVLFIRMDPFVLVQKALG